MRSHLYLRSNASFHAANTTGQELVNFSATVAGVTVTGSAVLDKGSTGSVISKSVFTEEELNRIMIPGESLCEGIGGVSKICGYFFAEVTIGTNHTHSSSSVRFDVIESKSCPVLIGQNVLKSGLTDLHYSYVENTVTFSVSDGRQIKVDFNINTPRKTEVKSQPMCLVADLSYAEAVKVPKPALSPCDSDTAVSWAKSTFKNSFDFDDELQLRQFCSVLYKWRHVFGTSEKFGKFPIEATIPTQGRPIKLKPRNIARALREPAEREIARMERIGIIEECPNSHGWLSPVMAVPKKKEGEVRIVVDYKASLNTRVVNEQTFPSQSCDDVFENFSPGQNFFSCLDLAAGYWQIPLAKNDRHKTAFKFGSKLYQWTRTPMGLKHAGDIFTRALSEATTEFKLDDRHAVVYIDDVLLCHSNFDQFLLLHEQLFKALDHFNLCVQTEKCEFLKRKVKFLGRSVDSTGTRPDDKMAQGIIDMKPPTSKAEVRSFCGRINFLRQFIGAQMNKPLLAEAFSIKMRPIYDQLTAKTFEWGEPQQKAFEALKESLSSKPFLCHFDNELQTVLATDASDIGCGAFLYQVDKKGEVRPIGAKSRSFTGAETRWSTTAQEAYGIIFGCEAFEYYLKGRFFQIQTDHKSLQFLDRTSFKEDKISRWQDRLAKFNFAICWIPGTQNQLADMLSRPYGSPSPELGPSEPKCRSFPIENTDLVVTLPSWVLPKLDLNSNKKLVFSDAGKVSRVTTEAVSNLCSAGATISSFLASSDKPFSDETTDLVQAQKNDKFLIKVLHSLRENVSFEKILDKSHSWYKTFARYEKCFKIDPTCGQLQLQSRSGLLLKVVPEKLISTHLHRAHVGLSHSGRRRTTWALRSFWWPQKFSDIRLFVQSCSTCSSRKGRYGAAAIATGVNDKGKSAGDILYIDFVSFRSARGLSKVCTVMDGFTRHLSAYAFKSDTANDAATAVYRWICENHLVPKCISSDRGCHFRNQLLASLCKEFSIRQALHVSYRPTATGILERVHRVLRSGLSMMEFETGKLWPDLLREVVNSYNAAPNCTTGVSPHFARFGTESELIFPDSGRIQAGDPLTHGLGLAANIAQANQVIKVANQAANSLQLAKNQLRPIEKLLQKNDRVQIFRPQNRQNQEKLMAWGTSGTVLSCNDLTAKVHFDHSDKIDWVSRAHLKLLPPRPAHLQVDSLEETVLPLPEQSGGGAAKVLPPLVDSPEVRTSTRRRKPPDRYQAR